MSLGRGFGGGGGGGGGRVICVHKRDTNEILKKSYIFENFISKEKDNFFFSSTKGLIT